jgi:nucleoside 2-deoxyribosyltransferase
LSTKESDFFTFVLMPFSSEFDDIYKLGIKEAAKECNVKAERLDEQLFGEGMLDRIYRQIDVADFIIADLSDRNANVFYELGYAHAKDKTCILLTKDASDIPFDLKHKRHIVYGESITYLKKEISKNIEWAKNEAKARQKNKISVITKPPTGDLTTSKHSADATITFAFDLHNKTNRVSPEISAIYLYTGNKWKMMHDTKECPYSDADIKPFKYRYFITPPASKIGKDGWAQVNVKASRSLAQAWAGDEIKSEYNIGGRGVLRLETADGNYDHEFDFNLELQEIPF